MLQGNTAVPTIITNPQENLPEDQIFGELVDPEEPTAQPPKDPYHPDNFAIAAVKGSTIDGIDIWELKRDELNPTDQEKEVAQRLLHQAEARLDTLGPNPVVFSDDAEYYRAMSEKREATLLFHERFSIYTDPDKKADYDVTELNARINEANLRLAQTQRGALKIELIELKEKYGVVVNPEKFDRWTEYHEHLSRIIANSPDQKKARVIAAKLDALYSVGLYEGVPHLLDALDKVVKSNVIDLKFGGIPGYEGGSFAALRKLTPEQRAAGEYRPIITLNITGNDNRQLGATAIHEIFHISRDVDIFQAIQEDQNPERLYRRYLQISEQPGFPEYEEMRNIIFTGLFYRKVSEDIRFRPEILELLIVDTIGKITPENYDQAIDYYLNLFATIVDPTALQLKNPDVIAAAAIRLKRDGELRDLLLKTEE